MQFFFGLLSLSRFTIIVGLVDRPVSSGILLGLFTGQWSTCIGVSVFFELLWLDIIPAGTYIPPHRTLVTFLSIVLILTLNLSGAAHSLPVMLACLPWAWVGMKVESWQRLWQNKSYDKLYQWAEDNDHIYLPHRLVQIAVIQTFLLNTALFALSFLFLYHLLNYFFILYPIPEQFPGWWPLWCLSLIGGILSLRVRRAYELLIFALVVVFLWIWLIP